MTIPDDFPRERIPAVVPGVQTKVGVVLSRGRYVLQTDEQRAERYDVCEGLAHQLVPKALADAVKHASHTHDETLERVHKAIAGRHWASPEELHWLMSRLRALLDW